MTISERVIGGINKAAFAARWLLLPVYISVLIVAGLYIAHLIHEVIEAIIAFRENYSQQNILLLFLLEIIDMALITQLAVMTAQGGYTIFISRFEGNIRWLSAGFGTSEQKIKLGMSVMYIIVVNLAKIAVEEHVGTSWDDLYKKLAVLGAVAITTLAVAKLNLMMHSPDLVHHTAPAHDKKEEHHDA